MLDCFKFEGGAQSSQQFLECELWISLQFLISHHVHEGEQIKRRKLVLMDTQTHICIHALIVLAASRCNMIILILKHVFELPWGSL